MAQEAPLYRQSLDVPDAPQATVRPIDAAVPDASGIGNALAGAAEKVQAFAVKMENSRQEAAASTARVGYLEGITKAQNEAVNSTDYANAPKKFAEERTRLEGEALGQVTDPAHQAQLRLHLTVAGISAQGRVDAAALARQRDVSDTALRTSTEDIQARAASAGSPKEREALVEVAHGAIDAAARAGTIDASTAFNRKALFDHGLHTAEVARDIRINPVAALAGLNDANRYDALTPFERESLKAQAIAAHDERTRLQAVDDARRDPAAAKERYGTPDKLLDVPINGAPLSFRGAYGVSAAVTQQLEHQANLQRTQDNALISLSAPDRDSIADAFRKGYAVDPESIQRIKQPLIDAAARGNTDATVKLRAFEDAQATYPLVVEAYKHTPEQVEGAVAGLRAKIEKDGGSAQEIRRLGVLEKVSSTMNDARANNPVGLIERQLGPQSVTSVQPPQNLADPQFGASLAARSVVASSANSTYGGEFKFFKPEERHALKPWFAALPPEGQAAAIGSIAANTSGPAREAAFKEITDGKPETLFAAGLFPTAPDVAASILQGAQGVDKYVPSKGAAAQVYATEKTSALPPAIFTTSGRLDEKGPYAAMNAAVDARYAYLAAQANDASGNLNSSRLRQAVSDVTGGVVYHNGAPTLAPARGMSQAQFDGVVWGLKDTDLAGAQTSAGTAITADYLRGSAKLRARSDGQYYLQLNQDDAKPQYAAQKSGAPFVLDLRNRKPGEAPAVANPADPSGEANSYFKDQNLGGGRNIVQTTFLGALSQAEALGIGGTQIKLYNDIIQRGRTAPITEADLSASELQQFEALVRGHAKDTGKSEGRIDYGDYGKYAPSLTRNILGGFKYKIADDGAITIDDKYDFNADRAGGFDNSILLQAVAGLLAPKNLAAKIGRDTLPDTSGRGVPVKIRIASS